LNSILTSIKKLLGPGEEDTSFDTDITIHINTALSILTQVGIGPPEGFAIEDKTQTWDEFVPENPQLSSIKSYIYLKVRLIFDPPTSSAALDAMTKTCDELLWRLNVATGT